MNNGKQNGDFKGQNHAHNHSKFNGGKNQGYKQNGFQGKNHGGGKNQGKFYGNKKPQNASPYDFVPLNEKIFYPQDFGEVKDSQISFDKPFADFQSGEIKLTIIAKSDIFVGGFMGKNTAENLANSRNFGSQNPIKPFFKIGDKYAISGSSVRGVMRTVAEILSFAKLTRTDYKEKMHPREKAQEFDMVERIFGALNDKKALKSRISFSHFIITKAGETPKFPQPTYIIMDGFKKMKESEKQRAKFDRLSGFKIYTPQGKITPPNSHKNQGKNQNEKVLSTLSPLGAGSEFTGVLRYFNLTKAELGLLALCLSALNGECFYKFGGAKFYGYGDAHIKLDLTPEQQGLLDECKNAYKALIRHANSISKGNFDLETRLKALQERSKIGGVSPQNPDTNPQNPPYNPRNPKNPHSQNKGRYNNGFDNGLGKLGDLFDRTRRF